MITAQLFFLMATPSSSEKPLEELEREISCAICHNHYERPKLLPCNHYYCAACIESMVTHARGKSFECPECRRPTKLPDGGVAELDGAFFVERLKDLYGKMARVEGRVDAVCEQCGEGASVAFCRQCAEFICDDCARSHKKMKSFSGHEVASLADLRKGGSRQILLKEAPLQKCPEHDDIMKIFCFDCNRLVCRDCVLYDHRGHKSDFVKKCAAESRKMLLGSFAPLQSIQADIDSGQKAILLEKHVITSQNEDICSTIKQTFGKFKGILDQRQEELIKHANRLAQGKIKALTGQGKGLEMVQAEIQSVLEFVERSINNTSDQDLMEIRGQLQAKLEGKIKHYSKLFLTPAIVGDLIFKPPSFDAIPKELGAVFSEGCAYHVTIELPTESHIGEPTRFFLEAPQEMGGNVHVQLRSLVDQNCIVEGSVGVMDTGETACVVTYTPRVRGRHNLVVKVDGVDIPGSPFPVFVNIHPFQLGKPVHIISGFNKPWGIAINERQQLVVSESDGKKVTVTNKNGKQVQQIKLENPVGVATSPDGTIYVTDDKAKCLFAFSEDGKLQYRSKKCFKAPYFVRVINSKVYVADKLGPKVIVMDLQCNVVGSIVSTDSHHIKDIIEHNGDLYVGSDGIRTIGIYQCKPNGKLLRQLPCTWYSRGLGFDKAGYLYVVNPEWGSEGVYVFNSTGDCIKSFGLKTFGFLQDPACLVIDDDGFVYVSDYTTQGKVYVF